jgi:hypothetical protein
MKSFVLFILGVFIGFILLSNEQFITSSITSSQRDYSLPKRKNHESYDPGKDNQFSKMERDYFNKIAKSSEYNGSCEISRWTSDMKIYVKGDKPDYLMDELNRVVSELNEIIDPIDIVLVDNEDESNYQILFGSEQEYNNFKPGSKEHTPNNWGLFIINSGKEIRRGTMYVDIEEITRDDAQKHILREELTQALGLSNDSYDYPESIFYQGWTETTEYTELDKELIQMMYN